MLLRRERNSGLGKGGTRDGGGEGMEKPTTDEVGSKGLEVEAAPGSQDVNDLSRTGGAGAGTSVDAVMSGTAHGATVPVLSRG